MTSAVRNRTLVHAHWYMLEDFPSQEGEYVVCFPDTQFDGDYYLDVWEFTNRDGWQPIRVEDYDHYPTHWCKLPMPTE